MGGAPKTPKCDSIGFEPWTFQVCQLRQVLTRFMAPASSDSRPPQTSWHRPRWCWPAPAHGATAKPRISSATFHFHYFQGSFFSGNHQTSGGTAVFLKRMVENNGKGINPYKIPLVSLPMKASSCFSVDHRNGPNPKGD